MSVAAGRSLQQAKLQALAGSPPWDDREWAPVDFGPGAALRSGDDVLLFPTEAGRRSLGQALVWAERYGVERLDLLIDPSGAAVSDAGTASDDDAPADDLATVLARRATAFARPEIAVHRLIVEPGQKPRPEPVHPSPWIVPPDPDLRHPLVAVMAEAGLEIVAEGGIVRGEVNGLEVARVMPVPPGAGSATADGVVDGCRLEVGVGQADRELTAYMHAGAEPAAEAERVGHMVRELRRADRAPHPLNQLVPERWLRRAVIRRPERVGLASLQPARRVPARVGMTETAVAAGEGTTREGARPVVAVFSVGIDTDLVPAAAEMWAHARRGSDRTPALWLVVPSRDVHPVTRRLASALVEPAVVVPVADDWRSW